VDDQRRRNERLRAGDSLGCRRVVLLIYNPALT